MYGDEKSKESYAKLSYEDLEVSLHSGAAFRQVTKLFPAGGPGTKVYPPTYSGGSYAFEQRIMDSGEKINTVLLDSVQSQANRMEEAIFEEIKSGRVNIHSLYTDFSKNFPEIGKISTFETPHRIADAIFRESCLNDIPFRDTEIGKAFVNSNVRDATGLFQYCPHALVFGLWDSTGPGGMGNKFQRIIVSEIVGIGAETGVQTSSRIDPLIHSNPTSIFETTDGSWTVLAEKAAIENNKPKKYKKGNKDVKLSEINLGNVAPTIKNTGGGVSIEEAVQTTVISLPALRRLRFTVNGKNSENINDRARTVLLTLALSAMTHMKDMGYDLRSRCLLVPEGVPPIEFIGKDGTSKFFTLDSNVADDLLMRSIKDAKNDGLPWLENDIVLKPNQNFVDLIRKSRELSSDETAKDNVGAENQ